MTAHPVGRRAVLAAIQAAALLPFLPHGAAQAAAPDASLALATSVLTHGASASAIGDSYMRTVPNERDAALLVRELRATLTMPCVSSAEIGRAMFRDSVRRAARRDERIGDVVAFGPHRLSRTEARLCALVALYRSGA
jgi:hypothetical protein